MTYYDFNLILIESIVHVHKNIFFENKRQEFLRYPKKAYQEGLLDAFKTLNYYVLTTQKALSLLPETTKNFSWKLQDKGLSKIWGDLWPYFDLPGSIPNPPVSVPEKIEDGWDRIPLPDSISRQFVSNINGPSRSIINEYLSGITEENPLIFENMLFNRIYLGFNEFIWKNAAVEISRNWFRVNPTGKPDFMPRMQTYFCYAFGKFEHRIIKELRPKDINQWIKPLINGNNYSGLKSRKDNEQIIREIDHIVTLIENPR